MLSILTECRISLAIQSSFLGRAFDTAVPGSEYLPSSKLLDIHMSGLEGNGSGRVLWLGLLLFVLALGLRVLFLQTIPDAAGSYDPYYKGDTKTWLDYAQAIQSSRPFDLGIPLRPPGVAYVVAFLWNGQESGLLLLKLIWSIFGAAAVALFFLAVLRSFGLRVAVIAAFVTAASTGLMILSTSLNSETPYLLLVMASFTLWQSIRHRPQLHTLLFWSTLHGLACLIRVEHVLFFALVSAYLIWAWARLPGQEGAWKRSLGRGVLMLTLFTLPLIPWQLHIWSQIERFNQEPLPTNSATERVFLQLEQALGELRWSDEAARERVALPAFCRRPISNFVAATVALRGGTEVTGQDFQIIEDAFGSRPEPIATYPFVALYGGLNFYLANNPQATGGFTRAPLEASPPLAGGSSRYPGFLIMGLPPPELTFCYPPHLEIVNHGYRLGWHWIVNHPGDYLSLALSKMRIFWAGVTLGFTGYNLPLGISGIRGLVDLVVPEGGAGVALWRWAGLAVVLLGLWVGRREEALIPWMLFLATKVITTLAFFGYAREGAVVIPVFALLLGLVVARGLTRFPRVLTRISTSPSVKRWLRMSCVLALILIALESFRWNSEPVVTLDGRQVGAGDPFPETEYKERRLRVK